jgi:hypothetical protein
MLDGAKLAVYQQCGAGEQFIKLAEINKAQAEAFRAQEELKQAGHTHEFAQRLASLEAAICAARQILQLSQKARDEIEAALRSLNLAKASL